MYGLHALYHVTKCLKKLKQGLKTKRTYSNNKTYNIIYIKLCKNQGGVKIAAGSDLSLVSGDYHEDGDIEL